MFSKIKKRGKESLFILQSKLADWRLKPLKGTIITGCVRSGTNLALRIYCPDLTKEEARAGSIFNEPQPLSNLIIEGKEEKALTSLPIAMLNRHHLIKSPHIAFILPYMEPKYRVIVIFRDLRLIIPSMFLHSLIAQHFELVDSPYWRVYTKREVSNDSISKASQVAELYYRKIIAYKGPIEVWNYGFWHEWKVRNNRIGHLYGVPMVTSKRVMQDVVKGKMFSDNSFNIKIWQDFCVKFGVKKFQQDAIIAANQRIKQLYITRGLKIKTLDDSL